jgi:hypothetical protein
MPIARLVTPTERTNNESINAFVDELKNVLGYDNSNWQAYSAVEDYGGNLTDAATAAYNACTAGDVLVTGGAAATSILRGLTTTIPIIQAVGEAPSTPIPTNLTGFQLDAKGTAVKHLNMNIMSSPVAVLYDNSGASTTISNTIYAELDRQKGAKTLSPFYAVTAADLRTATLPNDANSFMLIPNAIYFKHRADLIKIVDNKKKHSDGTALPIYYPECEYKNAHTITKTGVNVLGHAVLVSYRLAAHYANNCFTGYWSVASPRNLPAIQPAVEDS